MKTEAPQGQPWSAKANVVSSQPSGPCVPITPAGLVSSKDTMDEIKPNTLEQWSTDHWRQLLQRQEVLDPRHAPSQCDFGQFP